MAEAGLFAPLLCYVCLIFFCGLVGNSFVVIVYYRKVKPGVLRTLILALSVCDLLTIVHAWVLEMYFLQGGLQAPEPELCRLYKTVNGVLVLCSALILVLVALDRYRRICQPVQRHLTARGARRALGLCGLLASGIVTPTALLTASHRVHNSELNTTWTACLLENTFSESEVVMPVYYVFNCSCFAVCFIIIAACYGLVAGQLRRHEIQRNARYKADNSAGAELCGSGAPAADLRRSALPAVLEEKPPGLAVALGCEGQARAGTATVTSEDDDPLSTDDADDMKGDTSHVDLAGKASSSGKNSRLSPKGRGRKVPRKTTLMMFVLTAFFILSYLPYLVMLVVFGGRDEIEAGFWGLNLYLIARKSYFVNCAINPLVYGFCSVSFRRHCRRMLSCL